MTTKARRKTMQLEAAQKFLESLQLKHGSHEKSQEGYCVMEAVAYVAGEPHSDHPKCASRVLTRFCMRLNDRWDDERRQKLRPYVLRLVGTARDDATERRRAFMCADWAVRECLPMALDAAKVAGWPERLRTLPPIVDVASAEAGRKMAREARADAASAAASAAAYAADAAGAAYAADAADAAYAAYAAGAAYAAYAADAAAAADAAGAAAYAYAYAAAGAAREKGDASVLSLLGRLIKVSPGPFEGGA